MSHLLDATVVTGRGRRPPRRFSSASSLRSWLSERVLIAFADRILPTDLAVAQRGGTAYPDLRQERNALIAATAKVHGLRIVTRNVKDFAPMGVDVVNPWS